MSKFVPHTAETVPEPSREGLAGAKQTFGFVPNMIGVLAESPAAVDGLQALYGAFEQSSFSLKEREL
ncbi:MAG: carboxymuconolactone decarboxylase family protein, partial [Alphaproteobacteria bacterium]